MYVLGWCGSGHTWRKEWRTCQLTDPSQFNRQIHPEAQSCSVSPFPFSTFLPVSDCWIVFPPSCAPRCCAGPVPWGCSGWAPPDWLQAVPMPGLTSRHCFCPLNRINKSMCQVDCSQETMTHFWHRCCHPRHPSLSLSPLSSPLLPHCSF